MGLYIDIGLGVIILIALLSGTVRGFAKQFTSLGSTIGTLACAILFCGTLTFFLLSLPAVAGLSNNVAGWFSSIPGTGTPVTDVESLVSAMNQSWLRMLTARSETIFQNMIILQIDTLGEYLGNRILLYILEILSFIIIFMAVLYLFKLIRHILGRINKLGFFKTVDKLLGFAWSALMTYLSLTLLLSVVEIVTLKYLPQLEGVIYEYISTSYILSELREINFVGVFLSEIFQVSLPTL